jgi:transposase
MVATPSVSPAELRRLYEREELVPAEIGERFGVSGRTVRAWLQDSRITLRSRPERRRRHPPPEPAELGRQYGADGLTTAELAARHGVSASTIRRWLQDAGVPRRPPGRQSQAPTADVLRWLYQVEGLSTTQIGVRYGVSQQAAHKWLRAAGVPLRPQGQPVRPRTGPANLLEDPHLDEPASW